MRKVRAGLRLFYKVSQFDEMPSSPVCGIREEHRYFLMTHVTRVCLPNMLHDALLLLRLNIYVIVSIFYADLFVPENQGEDPVAAGPAC